VFEEADAGLGGGVLEAEHFDRELEWGPCARLGRARTVDLELVGLGGVGWGQVDGACHRVVQCLGGQVVARRHAVAQVVALAQVVARRQAVAQVVALAQVVAHRQVVGQVIALAEVVAHRQVVAQVVAHVVARR